MPTQRTVGVRPRERGVARPPPLLYACRIVRPACRALLAVVASLTLAGACIAIPEGEGIPTPITQQDEAGADAWVTVDGSGAADARYEVPVTDPHAVIGVDPSHGPFVGGQHAIVRGAGFTSTARVWFGEAEVPPGDLVPADPTRIQVRVPAGVPGDADVRVQNGDDDSTSRVLPGGYTYDPFYAEPDTAPTSGGTEVKIIGVGANWGDGTTARIGGASCVTLTVDNPNQLRCTVPPHAPGSVSLSVQTAGAAPVVVYDGFTYTDSENGFKGGLSGSPLAGTLRVAAYDAYTGEPIVNALVIAGDTMGTALQKHTDGNGVAVFQDAQLVGKRSVTVAKKCHAPTTFVDVPVDTVTAYLMPVMAPECGADAGDVPPAGGKGSNPAYIMGELVWREGIEFKPGEWTNVPWPKSEDERRAAYVFTPAYDPTYSFQLPDGSAAATPERYGVLGSTYTISVGAGNQTVYALAGIENRKVTPPVFTAYAFGMVQGIYTQPGQTTTDVYIEMGKALDQALVLSPTPPSPGPRGPDRLVASVAVQIGNVGYALFPNGQKVVPLGGAGPISIVGLPGLDGPLAGAHFVSTVSAVTGANLGVPKSVVGKYLSTDATLGVSIDGFVQVPVLVTPAAAEPFDGRHIRVEYAPGGAFVDVNVVRIAAGGGLMEWLVVAPAGKTDIELPDLAMTDAGLPSGPMTVTVYGAHIDDHGFDYGKLQYRHTDTRGWTAYAYDVFHTYY